jgi:hypothetical protein
MRTYRLLVLNQRMCLCIPVNKPFSQLIDNHETRYKCDATGGYRNVREIWQLKWSYCAHSGECAHFITWIYDSVLSCGIVVGIQFVRHSGQNVLSNLPGTFRNNLTSGGGGETIDDTCVSYKNQTQLTPCSWVGTASFLRSHWSLGYTSRHFMEPEGSSPCSQEPSTGPYPGLDQPSPYHPVLFL